MLKPVSTGRGHRVDAFVERLLETLEKRSPSVADMKAVLAYCETLGLTDDELGEDLVFFVAAIRRHVAEADAAGREAFYEPKLR